MAEGFDARVLDGLRAAYNIRDLREVCLRLEVDDEELAGRTKGELARELIGHMRRRGRLDELIAFLRADRPRIAWPDAPPAWAGPQPDRPAVPLQRPPEAGHFTGRGLELEQLLEALQPGRIVTLYGPGGIGKTALAAEALRALAPGDDPPALFPNGVLYHTFYGRPAAAEAAAEIARSCGVDPNPDPFAALAALRGRTALLILDGAEEADDLDALLARRGGCGVLIASRRRADVRETGIEVERLPPGDALALLGALARVKWADDEAAARVVCELVGNLPLALRLAGAFMFENGWSAAEYLAWLGESGLAALDFGARREKSVPILMAGSVAQVSAAARAALAMAGSLALAPFHAVTAGAALGLSEREARQALGELVNYELLRRPGPRYETAHALVHTYARERMVVETDQLRRLGEYYADLAEAESAKGLPGYQRLSVERAHVLAVLARLKAAEQWETANRLVWAVEDWLDIQGYPRDRIDALEIGLAAARAMDKKYDQGAHLAMLGLAHYALGNNLQAIEFHIQALAVSRDLDNYQREGQDLGNLGLAYAALGQVERAVEQYEAALAIAREISDRRGEGNHLGNLGNAYRNLGQVERAVAQYEAALAIAREIGDRRGEGIHLNNVGYAFLSLGKLEDALVVCDAALIISQEIGDRTNEAHTLDSLGSIYKAKGDVLSAIEHYKKALTIFEELKSPQAEETRNALEALGI
jgi:tetratricopeptide (TPR) repeat protein